MFPGRMLSMRGVLLLVKLILVLRLLLGMVVLYGF
jgi:hypothetical protein